MKKNHCSTKIIFIIIIVIMIFACQAFTLISKSEAFAYSEMPYYAMLHRCWIKAEIDFQALEIEMTQEDLKPNSQITVKLLNISQYKTLADEFKSNEIITEYRFVEFLEKDKPYVFCLALSSNIIYIHSDTPFIIPIENGKLRMKEGHIEFGQSFAKYAFPNQEKFFFQDGMIEENLQVYFDAMVEEYNNKKNPMEDKDTNSYDSNLWIWVLVALPIIGATTYLFVKSYSRGNKKN